MELERRVHRVPGTAGGSGKELGPQMMEDTMNKMLTVGMKFPNFLYSMITSY